MQEAKAVSSQTPQEIPVHFRYQRMPVIREDFASHHDIQIGPGMERDRDWFVTEGIGPIQRIVRRQWCMVALYFQQPLPEFIEAMAFKRTERAKDGYRPAIEAELRDYVQTADVQRFLEHDGYLVAFGSYTEPRPNHRCFAAFHSTSIDLFSSTRQINYGIVSEGIESCYALLVAR